METHTAIYAIPEIIIILMGVACIVWLIWPVREDKRGSGKAALDQAWREVLDDAYDMERRHFEERKRVEDYEHKRTAAANDRARYAQSTRPQGCSPAQTR